LSTTFWLGYYVLYVMRTGFIYAHQWRPDTGFNWRSRRRTGLVLWQLVPWVAIALYVVIVPEQAKVVAASSESGLCFPALDDLVRNPPGASRWSLIPVAMMAAMAAGLVVSIALDWHRESAKLRGTIVSSILLLMLAAAAASFRVDTIVWFYRLIGPLAALTFGLMFLFAIFTLLAVLSQKSGFPALLLVLLTVVISALFPIPIWWTTTALAAVSVVIVVMAALSRLWAVAAVGVLLVLPAVITWAEEARFVRVRAKPSAAAPALVERFEKWLAQPDRAAAISKPSKYPVFIIAVEGGGIYAATAASLFLAKLQDTDADFARHVFAISGVSGGAIGATIFQALAGSAAGSPPQDPGNASIAGSQPASADVASASDRCKRRDASARPPAAGPRLVPMVSNVMQGDHFSPVVGAIFPELLGASAGRAEALAESFKTSVQSQDDVAASELGYCFVDHWSESRGLPALVLNSTWVETGFRVAFAPFLLHAVDDSLYAFSDRYMPGDDKITLINAAVVSARFPLILPPYSILVKEDTGDLRWNFVDGGYSDSSGASTALAVYRALKSATDGRNVEIRVILLTGSDPQPDLTPGKVRISGTPFRDTLAPIAAVMKVRDGLGNQAVARICYDSYQSNDCRTKARGQGASLKIVEIEDERYDLPLGWMLSRTTFEVVQWMLGRPELCEDWRGTTQGTDDQNAAGEQAALERSKRTLVDNSCVLRSVADLLRAGKPLDQK
jgi:hypothetical protein